MAYEFVKLSEVEVVNSSADAHLLIEEDGEIKRLPASNFNTVQVQADWNETDDSSPAYIANKPDSLGGGAEVINYIYNSGLYLDGVIQNAQQVVDAWKSGAILRVGDGQVVSVTYTTNSGDATMITGAQVYYFTGSTVAGAYV